MNLVALALMAWPAAQASDLSVVGDVVHVRAPAFTFIKGDALDRLKQGRPVRFDLSLGVLSRPGGNELARSRRSFNLSYDLWEERFAVTRIGAPPASISHLTAKDAEAWCLMNTTLSVSALGGLGRDRPFWLRFHYEIFAPDPAPRPDEDPLTLGGLIDILSRRGHARKQEESLEAGPFRLPD
jgi:hypothetical protein